MTIADNIASLLSKISSKTEEGRTQIIRSAEISRRDREILIKAGWLQEIIRGWYMLVRPDIATGDTAAWYANLWDFIRIYLRYRFKDAYCLSAESSLDLHTENPAIPTQIIVIVKHGAGLIKLKHDTRLMLYTDTKNFPTEIIQKQNIQVMSLPYALCRVVPSYFQKNPREAELALRSIKSASEISQLIIRYQLKTAASRLIGAYQFLQANSMASAIKKDLTMAGIVVTPINPFNRISPLLSSTRLTSPCAGRIYSMWAEARESVIKHFPKPLGLPKSPEFYLHKLEKIYQYDAYNSLSIEGYQVTPELISHVQNQQWDPNNNEYDTHSKNAMAAKGYFNAFLEVKKCVKQVIQGRNAEKVVKNNLQKWYQNLFSPSVQVGIITPDTLLGYRYSQVFIRNSRHTPPPKEAVVDAMDAFFQCLKKRNSPSS